jgi:hypothetical protein
MARPLSPFLRYCLRTVRIVVPRYFFLRYRLAGLTRHRYTYHLPALISSSRSPAPSSLRPYDARSNQKFSDLRASETSRSILPPPRTPAFPGGLSMRRRRHIEPLPVLCRGIEFVVRRLVMVRRAEEEGIEGEEADEDDVAEEDKIEG